MSFDEAFSKLHGRVPAEHERQWLGRIREAFGIQDNDAFWYIVMLLEHYDSLYREYPKKIADEAERAVSVAKDAFAAAARAEAAEAERLLAEEVAKTSVEIARKLSEQPVRWHRVSAALAFLVLFGGICIGAGAKLASAGHPFWVSETKASRVLSLVLGAPAGWMAFILFLPATVYAARSGWIAAREGADRREKAFGWTLVTIAALAMVACLVILLWMV